MNGSHFAIKNPKRKGDMLFIDVVGPGGIGSAQVGKNVSEIERAEMPPNPIVESSRALLYAGKPSETATAIRTTYDTLSPLRGVAGAGWEDVALIYTAALQSCERSQEAVPILDQIVESYPKTTAAAQIASIRLAGLKNPQAPQEVVRVADGVIAAKPEPGVVAEANVTAGDALLASKRYEESLTRHLKVVVFSPSDRWLGARSLLGAAKAMAALNEQKSCVRALREILTSYAGTPQAEAAKKMLAAGGKNYETLTEEIARDEAESKKRLKEASDASK